MLTVGCALVGCGGVEVSLVLGGCLGACLLLLLGGFGVDNSLCLSSLSGLLWTESVP